MTMQELRTRTDDRPGGEAEPSPPPIMITVQGRRLLERADSFAVDLLPADAPHRIALPRHRLDLRLNATYRRGSSAAADALLAMVDSGFRLLSAELRPGGQGGGGGSRASDRSQRAPQQNGFFRETARPLSDPGRRHGRRAFFTGKQR